MTAPTPLIPAKAGTQADSNHRQRRCSVTAQSAAFAWTPAFAGASGIC
jgi:hypothetical protein